MTDREIDALVASEVMDYIVVGDEMAASCKPAGRPILIDPQPIPCYTTDMNAALLVFERFVEFGCPYDKYAIAAIRAGNNGITTEREYYVNWQWHENEYGPGASSHTLPMAICLAALAAKGIFPE